MDSLSDKHDPTQTNILFEIFKVKKQTKGVKPTWKQYTVITLSIGIDKPDQTV